MDADKVMEEEEEEEKEHFFSDLVPSDRERDAEDDDDDEEEDDEEVVEGEPIASSTGPSNTSGGGLGSQERHAQIGASPYVAPYTPLSSPNRPKTPSSTAPSSQSSSRNTSKKPQLVPMKNGTPFGAALSAGSVSKVLKDDVVAHLPNELVDTLMSTVQTLDKILLGVEDYKADQLGFLCDKVNAYIELLKKVDAAGANYHAMIPVQVLEMLDRENDTNPELFTKMQLEKCFEESTQAAGKVESLHALKQELEIGLTDMEWE